MSHRCVGCDGVIPWDGKGTLAYTCSCGATLFFEAETLALVMPASLVHALAKQQTEGIKPEFPHIDYYLGDSSHISIIKESAIEQLLALGFIWMKDCKKCQEDGTLERKQAREKHLAIMEAEKHLREQRR